MNGTDCAKQFLPYAALKGYDSAVSEIDENRCDMRSLAQDEAEELDRQLRRIAKGDTVKLTVYQNGAEEIVSGQVTEIDMFDFFIKIGNKRIPIGCIYGVEMI